MIYTFPPLSPQNLAQSLEKNGHQINISWMVKIILIILLKMCVFWKDKIDQCLARLTKKKRETKTK